MEALFQWIFDTGWRGNYKVFWDKRQNYVSFHSFALQILYFVLEVSGIVIHRHFSSQITWDKFDGSTMVSEVFFPSHLILP